MATAHRRNYASQAAPVQPRTPRRARPPSRLLIAVLAWGHGAAPADRTLELGALRLLISTFRFGMGASKGEKLGREGQPVCSARVQLSGRRTLRVRGRMLHGVARSQAQPAAACTRVAGAWGGGDGAGWPGTRLDTGCTVPRSPAALQPPQHRSPRADAERARSPVARGCGAGVFHVGLCFPFSPLR